jgi:serine/threonine protein kinase
MVGKTLGHYEILEPLGKGGMGEVYLGEDTRLGRKVAIIKYGGRMKVIEYLVSSCPGTRNYRRIKEI